MEIYKTNYIANLDYSRVEVTADEEKQNLNSKLFASRACVINCNYWASTHVINSFKSNEFHGH